MPKNGWSEGQDEVAAVLDVIGEAGEQSITGDIERRNDDDLVIGQIGAVGKNEIHGHIRAVKSFVHLVQNRGITHAIAELHELDAVQ